MGEDEDSAAQKRLNAGRAENRDNTTEAYFQEHFIWRDGGVDA